MSEPIPQLESVSVDGLPDQYRADWETMLTQWQRKLTRNRLRAAYYNGANRIKNLGIAVPDTMIDFDEVVGWPAKAVDVLANRIRFDGFVTTGDEIDPLGLDRLLRESDFASILLQATRSALIHSCSFVNVAGGRGQPISVFFRSALYETGIWDDAAHALRCALAIVSLTVDSVNTGMARPRELVLYEPDETLRIRLSAGRYEVMERIPNTLGHVPVYVLAYHQDLHRPFGRSRINREVMSLTDTAVRTMLRMEVSAEFYSSPQRYLLGAEPPVGADGKALTGWMASLSKMLVINRDEDGQLPSIGQFAQMTMAPHTDMLRALAGRFSGATGVPMAQLGVMTDSGPSSADAIAASETELVIEARNTCEAFGAQLCKAASDMAILNGTSPGDEALNHLKVNWRDPERPSQAAVADAVLKIVQAIPWTANSRVILEKLQFSDTDITRLLSDKNRQNAAAVLDRLVNMNAASQPANQPADGGGDDGQQPDTGPQGRGQTRQGAAGGGESGQA
ncbi:phage portal protein [Bifidobacterium jacchi]|nr:phage portal protein [Bifidobacterium jacchi]